MSNFFDKEDIELNKSSSFFDEEDLAGASAVPKTEDISKWESAARGKLQGVSWGFSDEAIGALEGIGRSMFDKDLTFKEAYKKARDESREANRAASEANPKTYMGAEIAGSLVAPGGILLGSIGKGAKGIKQLAKVGATVGGVEGGATGLGLSEEEDLKGQLRDTAIGTGIGVGMGGGLGGVAGVIANKFGKNVDEVASMEIPETIVNKAEDAFSSGKPDSDKLYIRMEEDGPLQIIESSADNDSRQTVRRYLEYLNSRADNLDEDVFTVKKERKLHDSRDDFFGDTDWHETRELERSDWKNPRDAEIDLDGNVQNHKEYLERLNGNYENLRKQGMVNKQTWDEFRLGEHIMRQMDLDDAARRHAVIDGLGGEADDLVRQKIKDYDMKDPLSVLSKWADDANVAARRIDDKTGLDIEIIQNKLVDQVNKKKGFDREMANAMDHVQQLRKKSKLTDEQIYDALQTGGMKDNPIVNAYRAAFEGLRERAGEAGITIEKRANYVPQRKKTGVDMIMALEKQGKKLDSVLKKNMLLKDLTGRIDWEKADGDLLESLDKLKGHRKDLAYLQHIAQKMYNSEIHTTHQLQQAIRQMRTPEMVYRSSQPEVGAAFARKGDMPDWLKEKNIDKLLWRNTDEVSHAAFVLPTLRALDSRIVALQRLGMDNAADWVRNYRLDLSRINRPNKHRFDITSGVKNKMRFWGEDNADKRLGRFVRDLPDFMEVAASSLYPNIIGGNIKAIMRNLTQPLSMTAGEMGYWKATPVALKSMGKLAKIKASGKWPEFRRQLVAEGTIPENVGLNDFEGIRSGVADWAKSKVVKATQNAIDRYARLSMYLYNETDTINRAVTKLMSEDIAADILKRGDKSEYFQRLPKAVQNKVARADTPKEAEDYIRRFLLVQTQLAYGQVGSNELGRTLGPGLTMLAKWPVAVTSDMVYKAQNKQFKQMMVKYFGPAIAASLATGAIVDNNKGMTPRQKELIGSGGFPTWLPYGSMFGVADITTPVNLQSALDLGKSATTFGTKALGGGANERDIRKAKRAARRAVQQYVPVVGGIDRQTNHLYKIFMNEDPSKK